MKLDWDQLAKKDKHFNGTALIINFFIKRFRYKSYLEIGLRNGYNYKEIVCGSKTSIDIDSRWNADHIMSSDMFFKTHDTKFDIIFVDGLHERKQVELDIINSLKHLNENGTIICHDVNPLSEYLLEKRFCNDAWQAFVKLRMTRSKLFMCTLPFDFVGIVRFGKQKLYKDDDIEYTWEYLDANRKELMNELTEEEFINIFGEE